MPKTRTREKINQFCGFTLLELLVVIAVLSAMTVIALNTFPASQGRARDAQRKNDVKQYQASMELYANNHAGLYHDNTTSSDPAQMETDSFCATVLGHTAGTCAVDPKNGESECNSNECGYYYWGSTTAYVMWAALERPMDTAEYYWIVCSNGRSGEKGTVPTSSACPL